jgi:hypothetical protein
MICQRKKCAEILKIAHEMAKLINDYPQQLTPSFRSKSEADEVYDWENRRDLLISKLKEMKK